MLYILLGKDNCILQIPLQKTLNILQHNRDGFSFSALSSFGVRGGSLVLVFALQVSLARILGVNEYGIYIYVLTWLNVLLLFSNWGWKTSSVKLIAVYRSQSEWGLLKGVLISNLIIPFISAVLLFSITVIILDIVGISFSNRSIAVFLLGIFLLPLNAVAASISSAMRGLHLAVLGELTQGVYRPVFFISLLLLYNYFISDQLHAVEAIQFNILAALFIFILFLYQFKTRLPIEIYGVKADFELRKWSALAIPLLVFSGFSLLMKRFDILMLGMLANEQIAGVYAVSTRVAELTSFGLMATNLIMAPRIAELFAQNKMSRLQALSRQSAIWVLVLTLPIIFITVIFGKFLLGLFGADFEVAYANLLILVFSHLVNALAGPVGLFMTMTGHQKPALYIMAFAGFLNVALNLYLIPQYSMEGAAVATAISIISWNLLMLYYVRKKIGIDTTIFSFVKAIK